MWETKKQLREEAINAEERAAIHFSKLNKIEQIIKEADFSKEMYYVTLDKIKRVIFTNSNLNK